MRAAHGLAGIGLAVAAFTASFGAPQPVAAEYCRPVMPDDAADTRGYAFRAIVTGLRVEGRDAGTQYVTLAIQRLYTNRDSVPLASAGSIELASNACDGFGLLGFQPGDDILMTTAVLDGAGPSTWNTAVWRVDGERLQLAVLRSDLDRVWLTDDRRIEEADSVREALALVAPEALIELDAEASEPVGSGVSPAIVALGAVACLLLAAMLAVLAGGRRATGSGTRPTG